MSVSAADLERILQAGENLPLQEYLNLFNKVKAGGSLSPTESKRYKELQEEVKTKFSTTQAPASTDTSAMPQIFKNALEIEAYLTAPGQNWKVKKSTIYNHIKARKLLPEADGTFTLKEVERWLLAAEIKKADGTAPQTKLSAADKVALEAAEWRLRKEKAIARKEEIKVNTLEGQLVPRDAFEMELAARATIFRTDAENFFRSQAPAMVNLVSGDQQKIPELMSFCIDALEQWLSRYLQKEEFKVDTTAYEKLFDAADKDDQDDNLEEET